MQQMQRTIREFVSRPGYKPLKAKSLGKKLGVSKKGFPLFLESLQALIASGEMHEGRNGLLRPRSGGSGSGLIAGIVKRTTRGDGYFIPHERIAGTPERDVYLAASDMRDAHTGDEVLVRLLKRRRTRGQRCGRVEEILERATSQFVGSYFERAGSGFVEVDGGTFAEPVLVGDPGAKGAQSGDKVVIEMLRFPSHFQPGEAVLSRVLGPRGEPGVDELSIICEFGLRDEFPEDVLAEARIQADQFDESVPDDRLDLTEETIVTIDPVDARDFDDAISLKRSADGHWHLWVHIADVAHFVSPGGLLDREAQLRGTSVYLPGRVLPMLPEVISNGLASLQQGKVRYAKSVLIEFAADGVPVHSEFANSAIKVTRRFAYEDVLPVIRDPQRHRTRVGARVRKLLALMHELAMILRQRRFEAGSLEMALPEIKIDFDDQNRVSGAHQVKHDESHQIIEEFMLAANTAVASALDDRELSFLRRVHADPDWAKLKAFAEFVEAMGFPLRRFQSRFDLQELLNRVAGTASERAVNYALLRSMKQAEYSSETLGHYALAIEDYCHFTSPIRRYPDLTVHRLIDAVLARRKRGTGPNEVELARLGKHCSTTERRAESAERELIKVKLLTFLSDRVGEQMEAVITGVERFGIFCQGIELPAEGLIHISWLSELDRFYYDAPTMSLIGWRTGTQFRLGDHVTVQIAHVDVDRRELDFRMIGSSSQKARRDTQTSDISKQKTDKGKAPRRGSRSSSPDSQDESSSKRRPKRRSPKRGKKHK